MGSALTFDGDHRLDDAVAVVEDRRAAGSQGRERLISPSGQGRKIASSTEMLLLRDRLSLRKYRKTAGRDSEKKKLLLELALKKIEKAERDNFIPLGFRKRRVRFG